MPREYTDEQTAKRILPKLQKLAVLQRRAWNLEDRIIDSMPVSSDEEPERLALQDGISELLTDVHIQRRNVTIEDAIRVVNESHANHVQQHCLMIDGLGIVASVPQLKDVL